MAAGDTCAAGLACLAGTDCASGICCSDICSATACPTPFAVAAGTTKTVNNTASAIAGNVAAGATTITLTTPTGFAVGNQIFIQQVQGTNAGVYEIDTITGITNGVATLGTKLANAYATTAPNTAQAIVIPQWTTVDVPLTATLTAPAWNGATGGVLIFNASGAVTVEGNITMNGNGFRGHDRTGLCGISDCTNTGTQINGWTGESTAGPSAPAATTPAGYGANVSNGGGGGTEGQDCGAGGGGSYGSIGTQGANGTAAGACKLNSPFQGGGLAGALFGTATLSGNIVFGGAGGEGGPDEDGAWPGAGGDGGGDIIILATGQSVTVTGAITALGSSGQSGVNTSPSGTCGGGGYGMGGGGGGAGGGIRIVAKTATLGAQLVVASGEIGGQCGNNSPPNTHAGYPAGNGGDGRIEVTATTVTGTTAPAAAP